MASSTFRSLLAVFLLPAAFALSGNAALAAPALPFPAHSSYAAGSILPSHKTQAQLDAAVVSAWNGWKSRYLAAAGTEPDGHPRYRVKFSAAASAKTVSEGQGYGMLLAVLLAGEDVQAQQIFDGLWEFCLDHPSSIDGRLMDWSVPANESLDPSGNDSAFDGDADIAMALLMADRQWGSLGGRFHYRNEALRVLAGLEESVLGPDSHYPLLGDWVDPGGTTYNQWTTRSSDFMPGHFRAFYQATGYAAWAQALQAVQTVTESLQNGSAPVSGLLPDFIQPVSSVNTTPRPASADFLEGPHDGHYWYNAGRDPWRLASDALISGDLSSKTQAKRMLNFIRSTTGGNPLQIRIGYQLDGTAINNGFSSFFAAPLVVSALLDPAAQNFLNAGWDAVATRVEGYYEDSVTLLSLLVMSGNFWDPVQVFADGFEGGNTARWSQASSAVGQP